MPQKLRKNILKWIISKSKFNGVFINNFNEGTDVGCFFKFNVQYPGKLDDLQ